MIYTARSHILPAARFTINSKTMLASYTLIRSILSSIPRIIMDIYSTMPATEYYVSSKLRNMCPISPTTYPRLLSTLYKLPLFTSTGMSFL